MYTRSGMQSNVSSSLMALFSGQLSINQIILITTLNNLNTVECPSQVCMTDLQGMYACMSDGNILVYIEFTTCHCYIVINIHALESVRYAVDSVINITKEILSHLLSLESIFITNSSDSIVDHQQVSSNCRPIHSQISHQDSCQD